LESTWRQALLHQPRFRKTLNLDADEPVTIQSLIHPDNLIEFEKLLEAAFEKWRPGRFETSLVKPNKTQLFVEGSLAPSKAGDMIVGIFTDITDRKRAEEVLTRQASHLLLASESLEKRDQEITNALETAKKYQEEHERAMEPGRINENLEEEIQRRIEAEETLRSSLQEKEVLLKEIHHRVKNNMQIISNLLNLQMTEIQGDKDRKLFQESQSRIRSMALIHEKLYHSEDLASVDFRDYTESLIQSIFRTYSRDAENVELRTDIGDVTLPLDQAIPCGRIINSRTAMRSNMRLRAREASSPSACTTRKGRTRWPYRTTVSGCPKRSSVEATSTLSLRLVKTLTSQIEGRLNVDTTAGTKFRITFPLITD